VESTARREVSIWWFAFGYFACYAPYSALSKALSDGLIPGMAGKISGFALLPITALASLVGMFIFITAMGWWKHAGRLRLGGLRIPWPGRWTFLSGLCTATIIPTTTLAYTFSDVSIIFMMLLMRGGLLVLAPLIDALARRKVRWYSWTALFLSLAALVAGFVQKAGFRLTLVATIDVAAYLLAYFIRLRFMSRLAKSDDQQAKVRYFVEEQMTATPVLVTVLAVLALVGEGRILGDVRAGFTTFFDSGVVWLGILTGVLSQGTGIFGGLILLDKRENTFCVPVNRASSVLAGIVASYSLMLILGTKAPGMGEMLGALLIVAAIVVLAVPSLLKARPRASAA
jgi:hypothetical protein